MESASIRRWSRLLVAPSGSGAAGAKGLTGEWSILFRIISTLVVITSCSQIFAEYHNN